MINGTIKVNLEGTIWVTKAVIPSMIKKKKGSIINLGSGSTYVLSSYPLFTIYAATKGSMEMFSRSISLEYKHKGIDIQCQVPLFVSTKLTKMGSSMFVPTPEKYTKSCTRWIGYESVVVPYLLHSLQAFLIRAIPHPFLDSYMLRFCLNWRTKGLLEDAQIIKASEASGS
ncbi:hypothetical protein PIB30_103835 [Stylosanthes scabra]|uniref:Uncharacterized protein n=1 Tax=Stylosanthes scabra TaxID=79078 RepID=A0ABU6XXR2_9FABA|nr:hypothetical protein [Stylosanthes scabra]